MELSRKKRVIIIASVFIIAISAIGGSLLIFGGDEPQDQQPRRFRIVNDPNLPNPEKQKPQEIIAYIDSDKFKQLSSQQKMNYFHSSGRKVMEHQMNTYASLPQEEKNVYLDEIIDRMETMREDMTQFRNERQVQRTLEIQSNPDTQLQRRWDGRGGGRGRFDPARRRARSERGTPERRALRRQFFTALRNRAQQRGIQMFGFGRGRR